MVINGEPSDKALVLLKFTQRSNGKQISNGFRLVTDNVRDGCHPSHTQQYGTISCCTIEKAPDFTGAKDALALAVICKVVAPSKSQHSTDLYIEAMEPVSSDRKDKVIETMKQLQRFATANLGNAETSSIAAWEQRKRRRLERYPTEIEVPPSGASSNR